MTSLIDMLAPTYGQMLGTMASWLDKAEAQLGPDKAEALLAARLAPDMFPLSTQIRFACVQALEGLYRLRGEAFPPLVDELLDEGRNAGELPGTLAEARARLDETIAGVRALAADAVAPDPEAAIELALPMGMIFDFTAEQYARDWALAQFYFHVMTAYSILRNKGLDLGKADYIGHLLPLVRSGTFPVQD